MDDSGVFRLSSEYLPEREEYRYRFTGTAGGGEVRIEFRTSISRTGVIDRGNTPGVPRETGIFSCGDGRLQATTRVTKPGSLKAVTSPRIKLSTCGKRIGEGEQAIKKPAALCYGLLCRRSESN